MPNNQILKGCLTFDFYIYHFMPRASLWGILTSFRRTNHPYLWGKYLFEQQKLTIFQTAWYSKSKPGFADVIASVRYRIWAFQNFYMSSDKLDMEKIKTDFLNHKIIDKVELCVDY